MRVTSLLRSCQGLSEQVILSMDVKTLQEPKFMPSRVLCSFTKGGDIHVVLWLAVLIPNGDATKPEITVVP